MARGGGRQRFLSGDYVGAVIAPATVDSVLERLGFGHAPDPDTQGLERLYGAWCRTVPFDNIVKRIHLASGDPSLFPNATAQGFFDAFLAHGTGGTCWPSSLALFSLLDAVGFDVRLASAAMADDRVGPIHSHGTLLVRVEGKQYWVDSSMLTDSPVEVVRGEATRLEHPLRPVRVEPVDEFWRVWWTSLSLPEPMGCLLLDDNVTVAHYHARYTASREMSPFNTHLFATVNRPDAVVAVAFGQHSVLDAEGRRSVVLGDDRERVLIEEFGYSEEIVARMPADPAPPAP